MNHSLYSVILSKTSHLEYIRFSYLLQLISVNIPLNHLLSFLLDYTCRLSSFGFRAKGRDSKLLERSSFQKIGRTNPGRFDTGTFVIGERSLFINWGWRNFFFFGGEGGGGGYELKLGPVRGGVKICFVLCWGVTKSNI